MKTGKNYTEVHCKPSSVVQLVSMVSMWVHIVKAKVTLTCSTIFASPVRPERSTQARAIGALAGSWVAGITYTALAEAHSCDVEQVFRKSLVFATKSCEVSLHLSIVRTIQVHKSACGRCRLLMHIDLQS